MFQNVNLWELIKKNNCRFGGILKYEKYHLSSIPK